jgi:hypothetical protein
MEVTELKEVKLLKVLFHILHRETVNRPHSISPSVQSVPGRYEECVSTEHKPGALPSSEPVHSAFIQKVTETTTGHTTIYSQNLYRFNV